MEVLVSVDLDDEVEDVSSNRNSIPPISNIPFNKMTSSSIRTNETPVDKLSTSICLATIRERIAVLNTLDDNSKRKFIDDDIIPKFVKASGGKVHSSQPSRADTKPKATTRKPPTGNDYKTHSSYWQGWFRRSQAECARQVLEESNKRCQIDISEITSHYQSRLSPPKLDLSAMEDLAAEMLKSPSPLTNFNISSISATEVLATVKTCTNSAPGDDRLQYRDLLKADESGEALSLIFNICLQLEYFPCAWKKSFYHSYTQER
jgi:hypothetical protein